LKETKIHFFVKIASSNFILSHIKLQINFNQLLFGWPLVSTAVLY